MIVSCKFLGNGFVCQSVIKICLGGLFLRAFGLLPIPHFFIEFLRINLGYILDHHCDVFGVEGTLEFSVVGCVLEDNSFAEETGGWSIQNIFSLFKGFGVVELIRDNDSNAFE
jgi:hypothetical protein